MLRLIISLVIVTFSYGFTGVAIAKEGERVNVAQLSARAVEQATRALASRPVDLRALNTAIPYFKVPAIGKAILICEVSRSNALVCFEHNEPQRCPTEVQLRVPGLDYPVAVGVTCDPSTPDQNGQCECELS